MDAALPLVDYSYLPTDRLKKILESRGIKVGISDKEILVASLRQDDLLNKENTRDYTFFSQEELEEIAKTRRVPLPGVSRLTMEELLYTYDRDLLGRLREEMRNFYGNPRVLGLLGAVTFVIQQHIPFSIAGKFETPLVRSVDITRKALQKVGEDDKDFLRRKIENLPTPSDPPSVEAGLQLVGLLQAVFERIYQVED